MKIAVNTRLLIRNKLDGIGWFTCETLKRITRNHPEHEFIFIFDRPYSPEFIFSDNVKAVVTGPPARHPFLWYWWFEFSIPQVLKKYKADVFLSPDGYLSLNTKVPSVAVIHDINFEHYPKQLPFLTRKYYRRFFPKFASIAKRIATVSEYSRSDISKVYKTDPGFIDVVYNGVNEVYKNTTGVDKAKIRARYSAGTDYLLFVGTIHPRKNIERMILAFDNFKKETGSDIKLLIVGRKMWWTNDMEQSFQGLAHKNDVLFVGRVDPVEALRDLVASALAMVYVPVFEGFGIPVIEAQAAGVPVIASNTTSIPEVTNGTALLCDPFSVDAIKSAMKKMVMDKHLRNKLIKSGAENSRRFTWDNTAEKLWSTLLKAVEK